MNASDYLAPPRWSEKQLDSQRQISLTRFLKDRGKEGVQAYEAAFSKNEPIVKKLFEESDNLRAFRPEIFESAPQLVAAARYLASPPISADDLGTILGRKPGKRIERDLANRIAEAIRAAWDPIRFPWIPQNRPPSLAERSAAIKWTAGMWAVEQLRTARRTESSRRQVQAVIKVLEAAKHVQAPTKRTIRSLDELQRGHFMLEALLAGTKCDVPVRLRDGRLLAVECKVSNSPLNSVKRLNRETGGKAQRWLQAFGSQVIPAAVLAGVYKLVNLVDAQDNHVTIFWEHDLDLLKDFVTKAK